LCAGVGLLSAQTHVATAAGACAFWFQLCPGISENFAQSNFIEVRSYIPRIMSIIITIIMIEVLTS
jgi:hypothetical protein